MMRRLLVGLAIVLVAVGGWYVWLMNAAGQFKTLAPHFDGTCRAVPGVVGAEDLTIHPRTGVAYLSSCDRRAVFAGGPAHGALFAYDLSTPDALPVNLTPDAGPDFCPHGISLTVAPDGTSTLFVIVHTRGRSTIEVFDASPTALVHRTTLSDPLLVAPNDLLAVSPTELYVTNDHRYAAGFLRTVEDYTRRPWANVVRWDGQRFHEAAGGIRLANGINMSRDGRTVYVAATIGQAIREYDRDPAAGALTFRAEIPVATGVDNIEMDPDGSLWIGAHPQLLTLVGYMGGRKPRAPSQILHVTPATSGARVEEIYLDLGDQLSAASVGAVHDRRLLIGPIADDKFLDCTRR
ncbi:MAG TPA: SMP-30/gluconolactonase/LRE family protein [Candidatus Binatia bacterium]|jgi:arylesterase/paraoxonase